MDIPGKLRDDIKRIYGAADPMNYIENAAVIQDGDEGPMVHVILRIPCRCESYVRSSDLYGPRATKGGTTKASPAGPCVVSMEDVTRPERVLFSGPKTLVFWPDGSKTMVSLGEDQEYDEYTAFCAAVVKKMFGATHKAKKFLDNVKVIQKKEDKKKKQAQPTAQGVVEKAYSEEECVPMEESV